jgi:dihydropteroate synthase
MLSRGQRTPSRLTFLNRPSAGPVAEDSRLPGDVRRFGARVLEARSLPEIAREIDRTESDPEGVGIMTRKGRIFLIRLNDVPLKASPLLKQEALSVGGDAAHARGVADLSVASSPVVLVATWGQYQRLIPKLRRQPFQLKEVAAEIETVLRNYSAHGPRTVPTPHRSLVVGDRPKVMGVLNVTPDSFSDGGAFVEPSKAVAHAEAMVADGADLIDIGGESTRPGAIPVSPEVEWSRIAPVLSVLHGRLTVPISVDTRHPEVAAKAIDAGADLVNDVEGLRSSGMREVLARSEAAVIAMHMRGTPTTMQQNLEYADLRGEVYGALDHAALTAQGAGIPAERILIDPGLGFGKSAEQSLELLTHAGEFRGLGFPVVIGASRKSFLGWILGEGATSRLEAGVAAAVLAAEQGVEIVRTHDVGPTARALKVVSAARRLLPPLSGGTAALAAPRPDD